MEAASKHMELEDIVKIAEAIKIGKRSSGALSKNIGVLSMDHCKEKKQRNLLAQH